MLYCVKGTLTDGHDFIDTAIANGATAIVCENFLLQLNENIQYIVVENSAVAAGVMAHNFYGQLTQKN